jgi:hypothetical protein
MLLLRSASSIYITKYLCAIFDVLEDDVPIQKVVLSA